MSRETFVLANTVVNAVDEVMGYWSSDLECQFANAAYETWFGISPQEMLGISMDKFLGSQYKFTLPYIVGVLAGEKQVFEREMRHPDGTIRQGLASYYPDVSAGVIRGFSVHALDITKIKNLEVALGACKHQAELLSAHDFLTGLPNRFLLMDRISEVLSKAEASDELVGIVSIKIHGLRTMNKAYGHDAGDGIIREISRRIKNAIQTTETVIRMSGVEFLLLVTGIRTTAEVDLATDRLFDAVQRPLQYSRVLITPQLSCGIAVFPFDSTNASELLTGADRNLRKTVN